MIRVGEMQLSQPEPRDDLLAWAQGAFPDGGLWLDARRLADDDHSGGLNGTPVAGGGGGAVTSVNGEVGDVVLTAADVGALDQATADARYVNAAGGDAWVAELVDVLGRRAPVYSQVAARLAAAALAGIYARVRGPDWNAEADPPPFTRESLYRVALVRCRRRLTPERLRADFVPWIATTAMGGVLEPFLPYVGRLADEVAGSAETKRRLAQALNHPRWGLNARVDALMARIPEDLVEAEVKRALSLQGERAALEAYLNGADLPVGEVPGESGTPASDTPRARG